MKSNHSIPQPDHWPQVIFDANTSLDEHQQSALDFHSLINLINIIGLTTQYWEMEHPRSHASNQIINGEIPRIHKWIKSHQSLNPKVVLELCKNLQQTFKTFANDVPYSEKEDPNSPLLHVEDLLQMIEVQIEDIELMIHHQEDWREIQFGQIEDRLIKFFATMEKHAKGRFFIHFQAIPQGRPLDLAKTYHITFTLHGQPTAPDTKLSIPTHFLSTTQDLMANARKYSPAGSIIRADLSYRNGEWIFTIVDNGSGIEADELEKVVQYGYRGRNSAKKPTLGAGCGLTKAVRLCQRYKGLFRLASKPKEGTWIQIKLPMA